MGSRAAIIQLSLEKQLSLSRITLSFSILPGSVLGPWEIVSTSPSEVHRVPGQGGRDASLVSGAVEVVQGGLPSPSTPSSPPI